MSNRAGLAAIRAVSSLHQEGYELLRVVVTGRIELHNFSGTPQNHLFCNVHLYQAGAFAQQVLNFEVDHVALSYDYTLNANAILDGMIYPDFDYEELGRDGWYDPQRMAAYLKAYELSEKWRGSDTQYVTWFKRLDDLAKAGKMPVMSIDESHKGEGETGAVLVEPYSPGREDPLFPEETS